MPSSASLGPSSPLHSNDVRRSRFTYRQLAQLTSYNTLNPLRVVAHIDLDAFYAQCEMVRLGVPEDQPLAVQQWQGLIAINYPARASGIGRHCNVTEAMNLCPNLIAQHVATWREGDDKWAYRSDAAANIAKDKVSLDPYRLQSRRILAVIKESLPQDLQKVEKASIDEVFLDLSAHIHSILLERFPELSNPPPYDDPTETLPLPSISALDWQADALVDLDEEQEALDPDWDDVVILLGSEIVRHIRSRIREVLGYTCSAGIANNKLVSKLGSAFKKPNKQTVVRSRAVSLFLSDFKITKMRNLGGKLGEQVISAFQVDNVRDLLAISLDQMKTKLGDDTGLWLHNTLRGIDTSEVNSRTQIKSMLSAKSFRPTISSYEQAVKWLRIFVADIFARLVEEGVLDNKRRPRTINLHHRHDGQMRSRQGPIPQGKALDQGILLALATDLLKQIMADGKVWPCANLSLSVGGFEDGIKGNMGIDAFVVKGEVAESLRSTAPDSRSGSTRPDKSLKRRRGDDGGIHRFFGKKPSSGAEPVDIPAEGQTQNLSGEDDATVISNLASASSGHDEQGAWPRNSNHTCSRCKASFDDEEALQSHKDWHYAKDLQEEDRIKPNTDERRANVGHQTSTRGRSGSNKRGRGRKLEQGQSRLKFG